MTLTKTQSIVAIAASSIVILAFVFAGILWAAETHFETVKAHEHSVDQVVAGFDKAINAQAIREIKRLIRDLEYKKQSGTITDQERWKLQGLYQELEDLT
jgi:hypothetical protein